MKKLIFILLIVLSVLATSESWLRYAEVDMPGLIPYIYIDMPSYRVQMLVFEGLVKIDENLEVKPALAVSWQVSNGFKRYRFKLRDGVVWHDGTRFTAKDVLYTVNLLKKSKKYILDKRVPDYVKEVKVINDRTVEFILNSPVIDLSFFTFPILPRSLGIRVLTPDNADTIQPIGTGPYMVYKYSRIGKMYVWLKKFKRYYGGEPNIDNISVEVIFSRENMLKALELGDIDLMFDLPPSQYYRVKANEDLHLLEFPEFRYHLYAFNLRNKLLQDKNLRLAMYYGFDRPRVLQAIYKGKGSLIYGPAPRESLAYDPSVRVVPYDPIKAKKLLIDSGYRDTDGDGILEKDSKPLKFTLMYVRDMDERYKQHLKFKADMKALGIQIELKEVTFQKLLKYLKDGEYDIVFFSWNTGSIPSFKTVWATGGSENFTGYSNWKVDRLVEVMGQETDKTRRIKLARKIFRIIADDVPALFLFSLDSLVVYSDAVEGIKPNPMNIFFNITEWETEEE